MKITINAGHAPGLDSGAVGPTGLQEAVVTRDIMEKSAAYLRLAGCEVLTVQENELSDITDASNRFAADLFVAIHCNAAAAAQAKGTETYCYQPGGAGEKLAACMQKQIVNSLHTEDRGVKNANFFVLRETECPAVLVETAFISNPQEEAMLASETIRDKFAAAIARGVTDYLTLRC